MSKKKFSVEFRNILYLMQDVIIYTIIVMIFEGFLFYYLFPEDLQLFLFLSLLIMCVHLSTTVIPALFLYFNYKRYNEKTILEIDTNGLTIDGRAIMVSSIQKIVINATFQHFNGHVGVTSLAYNDYYYYITICLKDNKNIYLTSLLGYEIDKELRKVLNNVRFVNNITSFPRITDNVDILSPTGMLKKSGSST